MCARSGRAQEHTIESPGKTPNDVTHFPLPAGVAPQKMKSRFLAHEISIYASMGALAAGVRVVAHATLHPEDNAYSVQMIMTCVVELDLPSYQRCIFQWDQPSHRLCLSSKSSPLLIQSLLTEERLCLP